MNKKKERSILCDYIQNALLKKYGFAPAKKNIALYEAHFTGDTPQYVLFGIGGVKYAYDGFTLERRV